MIDELKKYKKEHGDCNVPLDYGPNPTLGIWVDSQRKVSRAKYFKLSYSTTFVHR